MNLPPRPHQFLLALAISLGATTVSACGDSAPSELSAGSISICFDFPSSDAGPPLEDFVETVSAEVVFDKAIADTSKEEFDSYCRASSSRVLQVKTNDQTWSIGYQAKDEDGADITPVVDFAPGQNITLTVKQQSSWGSYHTFSARSEDGVLLTLNDGRVEALEPEAIEGLSVAVGEKGGGSDLDECGKRVGHTLVFDAQSSATLTSGAQASIELDAGPAQVMNVASWTFDNVQCTDVWGPNAWMAWRTSAL
ncbi:hypothetical protein [Bradymonas sediminis]|uniref:Uncharacterized protein n=1 Tax=Bradymonas sediminis TaxID=1548548 RepID=A0A2Z4FI31_9DELT|nr:hypothetical protein [Bradymonas sediminis]AWV88592.1 hypothetical protein DN745_04260 [Bradymonas sediminis]TDP77736.1 hypothetical protein DFR33_101647 [Bradymonas sediminis]